jgi:predicted RNA methylase
MTEVEKSRLLLQADLDAKKSSKERNRLGQFATPTILAREILDVAVPLLDDNETIRFLDPAFGTGSFYSALLDTVDSGKIKAALGFEIDSHYGDPTKNFWSGSPLRLEQVDFTKAVPPQGDDRFNLVICNPPYVRHHHIAKLDKEDLQQAVARVTGIHLTGLAGLYCYFLCLTHAWMVDGGIGCWLIPSEFMDVNYGRKLKSYLLKNVTLLKIHRFDPNDVQFNDALVSSAVVIFKKTEPPKNHSVVFTFGGSLNAPEISKEIGTNVLAKETKWTRFPVSEARPEVSGFRLSDLFSIKRGLATGDNKFFILTREQIEAKDLPHKFFRPILPSPRYMPKDEIKADKNGVPDIDRQEFLLDCRLSEEQIKAEYPSLWEYLKVGQNDTSNRYLCRSRSPWYRQEDRTAAPLLCTYLGRSNSKSGRPFRFILNHSVATATNVYLLLYPKPSVASAISYNPSLLREIWHRLNRLCPESMLGEGRVYGGGLHKLEPKELGNVDVTTVAALIPELHVSGEVSQQDLFQTDCLNC